MNITVAKEVLVDRLELATRVSTKHVTLPVLQCVLIEVTSVITFKATNLEIGIESTCEGKIEAEGTVAINAQTLLQTVQNVPDKDISLVLEDEVLIVKTKQSETTINSVPFEEFPTIPRIEGSGQTINRATFAIGIKTAVFAVSQSSIKPELGSVLIHQLKEQTLTFVATDSFRLMEKTVPQKGVVLDDSVLVPGKNAIEIAKVCESRRDNPELVVSESQLSLTFPDGVYITSRLTSGSFPDYHQIIPKEYVTHATLLKQDLAQVFKKTSIFLNKFQQVTLILGDTDLTVTANNGEVGATTESVSAQVKGDELTLNFNQRYVHEPLAHIEDDSIILHCAGIGRPMVIEGVNDKSLRYLVMPMNK